MSVSIVEDPVMAFQSKSFKTRQPPMRGTQVGVAVAMALFATIAFRTLPAKADPPGRVVVVGPGQQQPLGANECVVAGTTKVINGEPTTVVRVVPMPGKPKFVIGLPVGPMPGVLMYFPFPQDHVDGGITVGKRAFVNPGGGVTVVSTSCNAAGVTCEGCNVVFPPGSVLIPDPPQPPGLMFAASQFPADPQTETEVLASLGLPNTPAPQVFEMATGDMFFFINGQQPGPPVQFLPAYHTGDLNCDGAIDGLDIEGFVRALTDAAGYMAASPNCGFFYADVNGDSAVDGLDVNPFIEMLLGA